jgi:hypothetical protein
MPAKAVANPTNKRITTGTYLTTELRLDPMSGVMFAETHPTGVLPGSPYLTRSVTVKEVKA